PAKDEECERRGETMRMTIVAGLILGAALAVQSMLGAHARAKAGDAAGAVRSHARVVAPWYIAMNDRRSDGRASRAACALA
ncbi:MAG TPA: hypothetical protein VNT29_11565, partial [Candidatus Limnocylindrales bacterium]|nr:hypothetical protein [Candidatus Limnocylindrales bacterium]